MKKAKEHANVVLPAEPQSLVEQYLEGKERLLKEQVVSKENPASVHQPYLQTKIEVRI